MSGEHVRWLSDVGWVAVYEVGEAVRTRLLQLILLAYAGAIGGACWLFTFILRELETPIALAMGLPATRRPGAMVTQLLEGDELRSMFRPLVASGAELDQLLDRPLLGLWAGAAAMALLPLVVLFAASGSIATEVRSRSIRYLACRASRVSIGLGKLAGQLLLAGVAAALGVLVAWVAGMTLMTGNDPLALLGELTLRTLLACAYALPFAGLGLAASAWVPNANGARVLATGAFLALPITGYYLDVFAKGEVAERAADLLRLFVATTLWAPLWSLDPGTALVAVAHCGVLAVVYYAVGHARLAVRDL